MAASLHGVIVDRLKSEYTADGVKYGKSALVLLAGGDINNTRYFGSENVVFLGSGNVINHEAPACVAASVITMVAKHAIHLGVQGQAAAPVPVRLYAPAACSITTKHLSVGDVSFLVTPNSGYVTCKKLTLVQTSEEEPEHFEIVKSWVMDDDTEIKIVKKDF